VTPVQRVTVHRQMIRIRLVDGYIFVASPRGYEVTLQLCGVRTLQNMSLRGRQPVTISHAPPLEIASSLHSSQ
jgi:hypothetical protein